MRKISIYRYNSPITFSRRLITLVLDFLVLVVVTLFGYILCDQIVARLPNTKTHIIAEQTGDIQSELTKLLEEAYLGYVVDGNICDTGDMAEDYVTTLYQFSLDELRGEYKEPLYDYYGDFKEMRANHFSGDLGNVGEQYIYNRLLQEIDNENKQYYVEQDAWAYPMLRKEVATALREWLENKQETTTIDGISYNGAKIAEDIVQVYKSLLQEARDELCTNYEGYAEKYENLNNLRNELVGYKISTLVFVYLAITIIWYILFPIFLKNGASLSNKMFQMCACTKNGDEIPFWSIILKWGMKNIEYFNAVFFVLILLYSINSKTFMDYMIFGGVKFSTFYFTSAGFMILSVVCCAADKKKYRTLSDFISMQEMKDLRD
ncbi:MAG: RDD family protein [Tyzzerella sp.]|nr:RDD family protein [Tyzzerella sp.]